MRLANASAEGGPHTWSETASIIRLTISSLTEGATPAGRKGGGGLSGENGCSW